MTSRGLARRLAPALPFDFGARLTRITGLAARIVSENEPPGSIGSAADTGGSIGGGPGEVSEAAIGKLGAGWLCASAIAESGGGSGIAAGADASSGEFEFAVSGRIVD